MDRRSRSCEPHRCSSCRQTCYGPMEASGHQSFMEEVSILTISMFFIIIYLYSIICIYFDILLYDVLQLLHPYNRPSTSIDASMFVSTTDATVEATCSFSVPHTHVCVTFDKFTIVISLFSGILKFIMFLCFYRLWYQCRAMSTWDGQVTCFTGIMC
jgi:hypothetical protein